MLSSKNWEPKQGEEVQVKYPDGFVEIAKFIQNNGDGTSLCKVGSKRETIPNFNIYENWQHYKKEALVEDEDKPKRNRRDDDDEKKY